MGIDTLSVMCREKNTVAALQGRKKGFTRSRKALTIFTRDVPRVAQTLLDLPGKDRESGSLLLGSNWHSQVPHPRTIKNRDREEIPERVQVRYAKLAARKTCGEQGQLGQHAECQYNVTRWLLGKIFWRYPSIISRVNVNLLLFFHTTLNTSCFPSVLTVNAAATVKMNKVIH